MNPARRPKSMDRPRDSAPSTGLALAAAGAGAFLLARSLVRQRRWIDVEGKTALVTGGSRGFGLLLAREFAQQGGIVVLVNNAGGSSVGPVEVMTLDDYHEVMNIHFWGPLYTTMAALPGMKSR